MGRWQPDARGRLEQAALALYNERGFEKTTVAEIAQRAGLTERTFFRYFADKREVLFFGSGALHELLVRTVDAAPDGATPMEAVAAALDAAADALFKDRRPAARQRARIIAQEAVLQERELIKLASLASALAKVLRSRGTAEPCATLTAEVSMIVFRSAFDRWVDSDKDMTQLLREAFIELEQAVHGSQVLAPQTR